MISAIVEPIVTELLDFFESEFVKHEPEVQAQLIHYAKSLSLKLDDWAKSKIDPKR